MLSSVSADQVMYAYSPSIDTRFMSNEAPGLENSSKSFSKNGYTALARLVAKVILKEIMDQHPADHDLTAIWDVWFERMADGVHLVYLTPTQLAEIKQRFDDAYAELIATSGHHVGLRCSASTRPMTWRATAAMIRRSSRFIAVPVVDVRHRLGPVVGDPVHRIPPEAETG